MTRMPLDDTTGQQHACVARVPGHLGRGAFTASDTNINYRLGKLLERGLLRGTWLDCGCADGGYTIAMSSRGVEHSFGIDIEVARVLAAQGRRLSGMAVRYACTVSEALPFASASFDGVLLNEVLEHVVDEVASLRRYTECCALEDTWRCLVRIDGFLLKDMECVWGSEEYLSLYLSYPGCPAG